MRTISNSTLSSFNVLESPHFGSITQRLVKRNTRMSTKEATEKRPVGNFGKRYLAFGMWPAPSALDCSKAKTDLRETCKRYSLAKLQTEKLTKELKKTQNHLQKANTDIGTLIKKYEEAKLALTEALELCNVLALELTKEPPTHRRAASNLILS